ncbi:hypothetical protein Dda_9040 [Drechslerella dactyloides]|uniref:Uncharacterized protein n=1 Tax=Drechslerella dactyloides TaxID=74499 RepID=A0AAD6IPU9_DREDA|nr:hypothetical protein Dda_9040 [Drechslerella dactyloides]
MMSSPPLFSTSADPELQPPSLQLPLDQVPADPPGPISTSRSTPPVLPASPNEQTDSPTPAPLPEPDSDDDDSLAPPITLSASVLFLLIETVVTIRLLSVGSTPSLKKNVFTLTASKKFSVVVNFLRNKLKLKLNAPLAAPSPSNSGNLDSCGQYQENPLRSWMEYPEPVTVFMGHSSDNLTPRDAAAMSRRLWLDEALPMYPPRRYSRFIRRMTIEVEDLGMYYFPTGGAGSDTEFMQTRIATIPFLRRFQAYLAWAGGYHVEWEVRIWPEEAVINFSETLPGWGAFAEDAPNDTVWRYTLLLPREHYRTYAERETQVTMTMMPFWSVNDTTPELIVSDQDIFVETPDMSIIPQFGLSECSCYDQWRILSQTYAWWSPFDIRGR